MENLDIRILIKAVQHLIALSLLLSACDRFPSLASLLPSSSSQEFDLDSQLETEKVIVTQDSNALTSGCKPLEVAGLIMRFFEAFNRGDQKQLADMFLLGGENRWYSVGEVSEEDPEKTENFFVAHNVDDLLAYFVERHEYKERLRLMEVDVNAPSWHGGGDIAFLITRQADDLARGSAGSERFVEGKGAISCSAQKILVWSMTTLPSKTGEADLPRLCPNPVSGVTEGAVIACERGLNVGR